MYFDIANTIRDGEVKSRLGMEDRYNPGWQLTGPPRIKLTGRGLDRDYTAQRAAQQYDKIRNVSTFTFVYSKNIERAEWTTPQISNSAINDRSRSDGLRRGGQQHRSGRLGDKP